MKEVRMDMSSYVSLPFCEIIGSVEISRISEKKTIFSDYRTAGVFSGCQNYICVY
jgi:hypothetical protein